MLIYEEVTGHSSATNTECLSIIIRLILCVRTTNGLLTLWLELGAIHRKHPREANSNARGIPSTRYRGRGEERSQGRSGMTT